MKTTMNFGAQVNAWHEEWKASPDLQFQFPLWTEYAFGRRLRAAWDASADLQRQYAGDYRAFATATKKHASDLTVAAREKGNRDDAKRSQAEAQRSNPVGLFIRSLLSRQPGN